MWLLDGLTGLVNTITGYGGANDKSRAGSWAFTPMSTEQVHCAYRANWMARKAVDIPAFDMLREGWQWQGDDASIEQIEAEEARLQVRTKLLAALKLARLDGGAALVMSDGAENVAEPMDTSRIRRGGLSFISMVSRRHLTSGEIDRDPLSEGFGEPLRYTMTTTRGGSVEIHPSRVVRFIGAEIPDSANRTLDQWGDSILDAVNIAIEDATGVQNGIALLVQEARLDVLGIPNLMTQVSTKAGQDALTTRLKLAQRTKSMMNMLVKDAEEVWEQKTANFANLSDIERLFLQIVSGAADIPATRFLGQSPDGMNATGDGDIRNYYDRIAAEQELSLRTPLQKLMNALVPSALGSYPSDIHFTFNSLWQMTQKEEAEVGKLEAETDKLVMETGLVPAPVMFAAVKNRLIERGRYPGVEAAYEEFGEEPAPDFGQGEPEPEPEED